MHVVGFTIEIYYDARPYERQTLKSCVGYEKEKRKQTDYSKRTLKAAPSIKI